MLIKDLMYITLLTALTTEKTPCGKGFLVARKPFAIYVPKARLMAAGSLVMST